MHGGTIGSWGDMVQGENQIQNIKQYGPKVKNTYRCNIIMGNWGQLDENLLHSNGHLHLWHGIEYTSNWF
jgi:hypothetical protein